MQVFVEEYLLFGQIPMFFCFVLIGGSPVKVPEARFGLIGEK
jgi:hypothetical protein